MHRYSYRNNLLGIGIICTDIGLICGSTGIMSTDIGLICTGIGKICEGIGIMCTVLGKPLAQSCISNCSAGTNRGLTETDGGAGRGVERRASLRLATFTHIFTHNFLVTVPHTHT